MKTHTLIQQHLVQRLSRITRLLLLGGIAAVLTAPQTDARPERRGEKSRHHDHSSRYHSSRYRPESYRRGWSRPGFHGGYPPSGYVDYRYLRSLPRGYRTVYRGGYRYYYANGSYYWPARYHNSGIFISVRF